MVKVLTKLVEHLNDPTVQKPTPNTSAMRDILGIRTPHPMEVAQVAHQQLNAIKMARNILTATSLFFKDAFKSKKSPNGEGQWASHFLANTTNITNLFLHTFKFTLGVLNR